MRPEAAGVDLTARVGTVVLPNPVMTASGTAGHGAELDSYFPLSDLGAVVVKSLAAEPWPGNPSPRVHDAGVGMLNSVGLQGPGIPAWLADDLPPLLATGARVVVSIWGRRVEDYAQAMRLLAAGLSSRAGAGVVAVEVNVSCPNLEDRSRMFAHSAAAVGEVVAAVAEVSPLPIWVKLSPNVADLVDIAGAALAAGAEALTLVNTLLGFAVDVERRRPVLGAGRGGLSGPPVHPVAVRAVWDCREAHPTAAIVGVGGVTVAADAIELLLAGADAVQVGTATFGDPRACRKILSGVGTWCAHHGVASVAELVGAAHD